MVTMDFIAIGSSSARICSYIRQFPPHEHTSDDADHLHESTEKNIRGLA